MCGIVTAVRLDGKSPARTVWKRYTKQKTRGTDGFGFVELKGTRLVQVGRATREKDIEKKLESVTGDVVMFHHRYPTSVPNILPATHPIKVTHKSLNSEWYVIHNGVISNDDDLRDEHIDLGYKYSTEVTHTMTHRGKVYSEYAQWNDSEAFAIELARSIELGKSRVAALGSIAFVAIEIDKKTGRAARMHYGRNERNPLKRHATSELVVLASEGQGEDVAAHVLHTIEIKTGVESARDFEIGTKAAAIGYGTGYTYSVPKIEAPKAYMSESDYAIMSQEYAKIMRQLDDTTLTDDEREDLEDEAIELASDMTWYEESRKKTYTLPF